MSDQVPEYAPTAFGRRVSSVVMERLATVLRLLNLACPTCRPFAAREVRDFLGELVRQIPPSPDGEPVSGTCTCAPPSGEWPKELPHEVDFGKIAGDQLDVTRALLAERKAFEETTLELQRASAQALREIADAANKVLGGALYPSMVEIVDPGDATDLRQGAVIHLDCLREENDKLLAAGKRPAIARRAE